MAHDLCDDLELVGSTAGDFYFDDDDDQDYLHDSLRDAAAASDLQNKQMDDTSASDYKEGKDMQGIPWESLNYSRDHYREIRLKEYKNYQNLTRSHSRLEQECKQVERKDTFYDFHLNTRVVKSTIVHFQLRSICGISRAGLRRAREEERKRDAGSIPDRNTDRNPSKSERSSQRRPSSISRDIFLRSFVRASLGTRS